MSERLTKVERDAKITKILAIIEEETATETDEQRAERAKQEADESRFYCPHCRAYKPDHLFTMHAANLAGIGTIQWVTAICVVCRVILAEMVVGYRPDEDLLRAVQAGGGRNPRIIS